MCGVELPYPIIFPFPGLFTYPVNVQEFLRALIQGLTYPVLFPHPIVFPYPVKASIHKSAYFFESNNN